MKGMPSQRAHARAIKHAAPVGTRRRHGGHVGGRTFGERRNGCGGFGLRAAAQPVRRAGAIVTEPAVAAAPMSCLLCMVLDLMRSGEGRSLTPSGR